MSNDFLVEILPAGNNDLRIFLSATAPPLNRQRINRQRIHVAPDDLNALRRGDSQKPLTDKVAQAISQWLIEGELGAFLDTAFKAQGDESIRLVFSVDEELLPMLADLPVELLYFQGGWFALRPRVDAIVHQLQKASNTPTPPASHDWPLRVLIVRSNPRDLGGAVPEAASICDNIIALTEELGPNLVQVDLISREASDVQPAPAEDKWPRFRQHLLGRDIKAIEPATWENFRKCLRRTQYDLLIYLGHGNLPESDEGALPLGVLELEKPDGNFADSITAEQLKYELQNYPVPVVLLAGCVTASEFDNLDEERRAALLEDIPRMMRGSQGVAQALVNSEAGVQFAVGMRYRLETNLATSFLNAFFDSLLSRRPGHVEAAIRAGREEMLALTGPYPPSWSAPVVFRTLGKEPMFEFLTKPPQYAITLVDIRDQEYRERAWGALCKQPGMNFAYEILDDAESKLRERALAAGAVLAAARVETKAGEPVPPLHVRLHGNLAVEQVRVTLTAGSELVRVESVHSTVELQASGYQLQDISESGSSRISFTLKWAKGGAPTPLPQEQLVEVRLQVSQTTAMVCSVNLDVETQPPRVVRPINNALIVSLS